MPPKSKRQERLMQAVKHNPEVARKTGISKEDAKRVLGEHGREAARVSREFRDDDEKRDRKRKKRKD